MILRNLKEMVVPNMFVTEHFITAYNCCFAVKAETAQRVWRIVSRNVDIERTIIFCYHTVVGIENIVYLRGMKIDTP